MMGKLTPEELVDWRDVCVRQQAIELNPRAFSQRETLDLVERKFAMVTMLEHVYALDTTREWQISPYDGTIYYPD
jgi:hypothetical protein